MSSGVTLRYFQLSWASNKHMSPNLQKLNPSSISRSNVTIHQLSIILDMSLYSFPSVSSKHVPALYMELGESGEQVGHGPTLPQLSENHHPG